MTKKYQPNNNEYKGEQCKKKVIDHSVYAFVSWFAWLNDTKTKLKAVWWKIFFIWLTKRSLLLGKICLFDYFLCFRMLIKRHVKTKESKLQKSGCGMTFALFFWNKGRIQNAKKTLVKKIGFVLEKLFKTRNMRCN